MSSIAKTAATKLDWAKVISSLGLTGSTAASLTSFKKRNDEAKRVYYELSQQPAELDFSHYKSVLKNQKIIEEIEQTVQNFKPVTYDVSKQLKTIDLFEAKALENASSTETVVTKEIEQLQQTLSNIESARPFNQLTVDDVVKAAPEIEEKLVEAVKKGRWNVPAYREKFGDLTVM